MTRVATIRSFASIIRKIISEFTPRPIEIVLGHSQQFFSEFFSDCY